VKGDPLAQKKPASNADQCVNSILSPVTPIEENSDLQGVRGGSYEVYFAQD
jgi:hypothetical protein